MDLEKLKDIALEAALAAGKVIQEADVEKLSVEEKKDGGENPASQVVTAIDRAAEQEILHHLLPTCTAYDLALLTEESPDDKSRFEKDYFWCIDPLDGTLPFIQNRAGYTVSIALVAKDGNPVIGVVYNPRSGSLYHAAAGQGAFKDGKALKASCENNYLTYVTDKKLKDTPRVEEIEVILQEKAKALSLKNVIEVSGGAAVYNALWVIENGPALMMKFPKKEKGGGSLWDYAATACIFQELGLAVTNHAGATLDLNRQENTFMNHEGIYFANLPAKNI